VIQMDDNQIKNNRKDELQQFFHDFCASVMCEPVSLDPRSFRDAVLNLGLGYGKGAARTHCKKYGQNGEFFESDFITYMEPWVVASPKTQSIKAIFKSALLADVYGQTPPSIKSKQTIVKKPKLPKKPSLRHDPTKQDLKTLKTFFEETSDLSDQDFTFPNFRDDLLPSNISLTHLHDFVVPFTFEIFIKLFLLQECFYSSIQHSLENGLYDPILTLWFFDNPWFRRGFTCVADVVEVPSFLSGKISETTPVQVITRLKQIQPGAFVYHFRTETLDAPCGNMFYSHEVWQIRQLAGSCKIEYLVGLEWRQNTWLRRPITSLVNRGCLKATKLYFETIVEKFNKNEGLPSPRKIKLPAASSSKATLSRWIWGFSIIFLLMEFSFPDIFALYKLGFLIVAFCGLAHFYQS